MLYRFFTSLSLIALFLSACGDTQTSSSNQEQSNDDSQAVSSKKAWADATNHTAGGEAQYKEGELLVKFKEDVRGVRAAGFRRAIGARLKNRFEHIGVEHVELPPGLSVKDAIRLYMEDPMVEYAEPNYIVRKAAIPNDTYFVEQYGLHNIGQPISVGGGITGTNDADIDAPEAWDLHTGLGNVVVAVLDTGTDYDHPDLSANMWQNTAECNGVAGVDDDLNGKTDDCKGWNFAYNTSDPMDDDRDCTVSPPTPSGHGTHVSGIIGAIGNNASGVSGVNWNVKIMPLKFMDSCGGGFVSDAVAGINYAITMKQKGHNIRAINASYGGTEASVAQSSAITAAGNEGILFIAAAGNDGQNNDSFPFYPASDNLPTMITVAASDQNDNKAHFSNYSRNTVHVAAPGAYILSTLRFDGYQYGYVSGTSMATPMVTGLVALISSYNSTLTVAQIKEVILSTVDKKPQWSGYTITEGRINAHSALLLANTPAAILMPPSHATAALNGSVVNIAWTDNSSNETGFDIERKAGSCGTYISLAGSPTISNSFTDFGPFNEGTTYYYHVAAVNSMTSGRSSPSSAASVTTALPAPSGLIANTGSSSIELYWTDNSTGETGFKIERKTSSETSWSSIATVGPNITTYSDRNYFAGFTYDYRVKAYTSVCSFTTNSSDSAIATATAPGGSGSSGGGGGGGGCFIATAAYGSYLSPEVQTLRDFRDSHLLTNPAGRAFVRLYYRTSPPIADFISRHEPLRTATRLALSPIVYGVKYPSGSLAFIGLIALALIVRTRKSYN